jgi:hypothetical protein
MDAAVRLQEEKNVRTTERPVPMRMVTSPTRYRFLQVTPARISKNKMPAESAPTVLSRFDWEQAGNKIRIIDADGSVYEGRRETVTNYAGRKETGTNAIPFSVRGTNRTLSENLILSGTLQFTPTSPPDRALQEGRTLRGSTAKGTWVLSGTVKVGTEEAWQIRASQDVR